MAGVIVLCGKICSGKTHYARKLCAGLPAVYLSCDELTLDVLGGNLGEQHDILAPRIQRYLLEKAVSIARAGADAVLDSGFWSRADRDAARRFFADAGVRQEWRYLSVDDGTWQSNIRERNAAVVSGAQSAYFVDEGLLEKCVRLFEAPGPDETFTIIDNHR